MCCLCFAETGAGVVIVKSIVCHTCVVFVEEETGFVLRKSVFMSDFVNYIVTDCLWDDEEHIVFVDRGWAGSDYKKMSDIFPLY